VTLKYILLLLIFTLLSVYLAFLNPHDVDVYLTQSFSLHMPMVILLLGFILIGVIITATMNWALKVKSSFGNLKTHFKHQHVEKRQLWCRDQYERGKNIFAGGNLEKAKVIFNKILEEFPNHAGALNYTGEIARKTGNSDLALELHLKASKITPASFKTLNNLAEDYSSTGLLAEETATLEKIRQGEPDSPVILSRIRDSHLKSEDWKNASALQKRIVSLTSDKQQQEKEEELFSQITYRNGLTYWEKGQVDSAISEFKKALRISGKCVPAYITLGDAYLKSGNKKNALKTWEVGLTYTHSPLILLRLQKTFQEADDLKGLERIYQEAIKSSNNSVKDTLVLLNGVFHLDRGETEEAIQALETIKQDKSVLQSVLLANAYQQKHDSSNTEKAVQSAFSLAKESLIKMVCAECNTPFKEWSSNCPECKTWNSLKLASF
jgi:lipopolysaccharide biosynthesis regulator YciM